MQEDNTSS